MFDTASWDHDHEWSGLDGWGPPVTDHGLAEGLAARTADPLGRTTHRAEVERVHPVAAGSCPEESAVPSATDFAVFYQINPATASKGVNVLVELGVLYKKRGIGMFVRTGARGAAAGPSPGELSVARGRRPHVRLAPGGAPDNRGHRRPPSAAVRHTGYATSPPARLVG